MEVTEKACGCGEEKCIPCHRSCEYIEGNVSKPIPINKSTKACEIRVDLEVQKRRSIRIWGQITDCKGDPVKCALVKLVKERHRDCKGRYEGVAHGVTDCLGFYQFDVCIPDDYDACKYRVFVSKQATGDEIRLDYAECDPCHDDCKCGQ